MNLFNLTKSFLGKIILLRNRNISLIAVPIFISITSLAAEKDNTDRFSESPLKNGIASGWHLKIHKGELTPILSDTCVSKPSSQCFELKNALGYLISGDRGNSETMIFP